MTNNLKELIKFSKSLNILFIEDNEDVRVQLVKLLKNFFVNLDVVENGLEGYEKYIEYHEKNGQFYDLIITDLSMPKLDGVDLCKKVIEINKNQIILVVSAHTESHKLLKLIDIGIYKFLQKPVNYENLLNNITLIISKLKREKNFKLLEDEIVTIKNDNEKLNELVITDKLTSIYNRRFIDNMLTQKFQDLEENCNKNLSIIFIDIDNFKSINDTYGHVIGDDILIEFAQKLKTNIRSNDLLGRWGGEEFIIICDRTDLETTKNIAEKLRKLIENTKFLKVEKLTASFGISSYIKNDSAKSLIEKADISLYKAKKDGKNRVCAVNSLKI